jgi:FKBP-type peptidyl-prolyl cis-trans isomerase FkpA
VSALTRLRKLIGLLLLVAAYSCGSSTPAGPDQSNVPYSATDLNLGSGTEATARKTVTVKYVGWLYDESAPDHKGTQVDANMFSFVLGDNTVIQGFEMAVTGMKIGGTRRAVIPPSLAYGTAGNPAAKIGPNATLVFDITLLDVL